MIIPASKKGRVLIRKISPLYIGTDIIVWKNAVIVLLGYSNMFETFSNSKISFSNSGNFIEPTPFLKEKKQRYPVLILFVCRLITEYPRLLYLFLSTAFLATFFDTEKEN